MTNHYETLGIPRSASAADVKSAYRRLVLLHHPDRSRSPDSKAVFLKVTAAYELLSNPEARSSYDEYLAFQESQTEADAAKRVAEGAAKVRAAQEKEKAEKRRKDTPLVTLDERNRLASLFSKGRLGEADEYARTLLLRDPRFGLGYGVLGDLARMKGDLREAAKQYAYAVQFEPANEHYQRRYEQALASMPSPHAMSGDVGMPLAVGIAGCVMVGGAAAYVGFSRERPLFAGIDQISTWTFGLILMMFLSGVVVGVCGALSSLLVRFEVMANSSSGTVSPVIALGLVALANFWAAAALYILISLSQNAFTQTVTRLMSLVAGATLVLALSSTISGVHSLGQVLLWGGNVVYFGAMAGWLLADSMRRG